MSAVAARFVDDVRGGDDEEEEDDEAQKAWETRSPARRLFIDDDRGSAT
jgi:hypothetical protein